MKTSRRWVILAMGLIFILLGVSGLLTAARQPGNWHGHMVGSMGPGMMSGMGPGMMSGAWGFQRGANNTPPEEEEIPPETTVIEMHQMRFKPQEVQVAAGTTILFINRDPYPHRIVQASLTDLGQRSAGFTSPTLNQGQRWSYTFSSLGTFSILCDVGGHHLAGMVGQIVVR